EEGKLSEVHRSTAVRPDGLLLLDCAAAINFRPMSLTLLVVSMAVILTLGYRWYGGYASRQFQLDPARTTPAVEQEDGVDFVPTPRFYLMGQHLSAIAAAGPIAGPILAAQLFGWGPSLLWIAL